MTQSTTGMRHADIEAKFRSEILDAVLATPDSAQLRVVLLDKVFGTVTFLELPKYRQAHLEGYFLGICDILAKLPAAQRSESGIRPAVKRPPGRPRKTPPPQKPKSLPSALLTRIEALPRRTAFTIVPPPMNGSDRDPQNQN